MQMIEVDRLMIEDYGIQLIQMMENAGRNLAELARQILGGTVTHHPIVALCGGGNNGGGTMVAARHLHNWGANVQLKLVADPHRIQGVPAHQRQILAAMGVVSVDIPDLDRADLILDGLIGYGLTGDPRGSIAEWIDRANTAHGPILALDTPSGLDMLTGIPGKPCVRATATLTLALPKVGLLIPPARPFVGDLYLADIGVPPELYRRLGIDVDPVFTQNTIVRLW